MTSHTYPLAGQKIEHFTGHNEGASAIGSRAPRNDTGLTYMQARYYDPVIGRFLSNDPVGFASGGVNYFNRYSYTANNPVNNIDPDGRVIKLAKAAFNIGKRTIRNRGNLGKAIKEEGIGIADNVSTIFSGGSSLGDKAFAAFDLATGFGSEAKGTKNLINGGRGKQ